MTTIELNKFNKDSLLSEWLVPDMKELEKLDIKEHFESQRDFYARCRKLSENGEMDEALTRGGEHLAVDLLAMQSWVFRKRGQTVPVTPKRSRRIHRSMTLEVEDIVQTLLAHDFLSIQDEVVDAFQAMMDEACKINTEYRDSLSILSAAASEMVQSPVAPLADSKNKRNVRAEVKGKVATTPKSTRLENNQENVEVDMAATVASTDVTLDDDDMSMFRSCTGESDSEVVARDSPDVQATTTSANSRESIWMHRERLPEADADRLCFVCQKATNDSGEVLEQCQKKHEKGARCATRFHVACIKVYNAGEYLAEYRRVLGGGQLVCPLHHCSLCWIDRYKSTAIQGNLIQCGDCYRSFHEKCRPAGAHVVKDMVKLYNDDGTGVEVRIDKTTCHSHCKEVMKKNARTHVKFCCECEEVGTSELEFCSRCIMAYHPECRRYGDILGNEWEQKPVCESCVLGESMRVGQKAIAKYLNSFFPCVTVSLDDYPAHCASVDKYGSRLGDPGFVAVKWAGCENLFSLLPAWRLMPMFTGSYQILGKKMTDKDIRNAWAVWEIRIIVPRPQLNLVQEKYMKIKTSVYHPEFEQKPRLEAVEDHDVLCECKPDAVDRCGPNSKCTNRDLLQDCPEACEKIGSGCNNRWISRKEHNPHIELREAAGKGQGVFATALIKKNDHVAEYAGEIISVREKQRRIQMSATARNDEEKHYMMELDSGRFIDCRHKGNIARFLNHSCDPNCVVEHVSVIVATNKTSKSCFIRYDRRISIRALRDIEKGEELSFNYDMQEFSSGTSLPECKCGSANCTGILGKAADEKRLAINSHKKKDTRDREDSVSSKGSATEKKKKAATAVTNGPSSHARKRAAVATPSMEAKSHKKAPRPVADTSDSDASTVKDTKSTDRKKSKGEEAETSSAQDQRTLAKKRSMPTLQRKIPDRNDVTLVPMLRPGSGLEPVVVPLVGQKRPVDNSNAFLAEAQAAGSSYIRRIERNAKSSPNAPVDGEEEELRMFTPSKQQQTKGEDNEACSSADSDAPLALRPHRSSRGVSKKKFSP